MSARASGYMKGLVFCPNGERLTPREKLVGMVLADSHQDKAKSFTYPSVETIAEESLSDKRTCQRYIDGLERKGVIVRLRPKGQGRGSLVFYFFPALDVMPEGWQDATLFSGPLFAQKGGERVAEGWQKGGRTHISPVVERAREREQQQEQEQVLTPLPPQAGECGKDRDQVSEFKDPERQKHAAEKEAGAQDVAENAVPKAKSERVSRDGAVGDGDEGADRCGAAEADSLDAAQLAHIAGLHAGADRRLWEEFYREQNRKAAADAAPNGAEAQALEGQLQTVPAATDWVMKQCGWPARFDRRGKRRSTALERAIAGVLQLELERGQPLWVTAPKMAEAWKKFKRNGENISVHWGPVKFFELAIWSDENGWAWKEEKLERLGVASVGSMR